MEAQAKDAVRRLSERASHTRQRPFPSDSDLQVGPLQEDTNGNKFYTITVPRDKKDATWRFYPPDKDGVLLAMAIYKPRFLKGHRVSYMIDDPAPLLHRKVRFAETVIPDVDAFVARIWRRDLSEVNHRQAKSAVRRLTRHLLVAYPTPSDSDLQVGEPQEDKAGNRFCPVMDLRSDIPSVSWRFYPPNDEGVLMAVGLRKDSQGTHTVTFLVDDPQPLFHFVATPGNMFFPLNGPNEDERIARLWRRDLHCDICDGDIY